MTIRKIARSRAAVLTLLSVVAITAATVSLRAEIFYPWKGTHVGALDGKEWFGLVLAPAQDVYFGLRLRVSRQGQTAEGEDFFYLVSEVGPHSPDGSYSRVAADPSLPFKQGNDTPVLIKPPSRSDILTLEWSRQNEGIVLGRIRAPKNIAFQVVHYFPWGLKGRYQLLAGGPAKGAPEWGAC